MKAILLVASGLLSIVCHGFASTQSAIAPQDAVELRIERVVRGLLPGTAFTDRFAAPAPLKDRMAFYHTPGVSIAVINNYRIEWARGFGVKEYGKRAPVTETTLFQAGSIGKAIFALGVMRLVQQGRLDLDEDVNHYLTSWKVPPSGSWQPRITLRQLLSHTAGFTVHGFLGYEAGDKIPTIVDVLQGRLPAETPPVIVTLLPGTQFRYSGGGITVAQLAVTDALREPFPQIMRHLVFDPLGMKHSTYEQPLPKSWQAFASTSHPWKNHPIPGKWYIHPELAAAGLWTTPSDLARALLEVQLSFQGKSNTLLSASRAVEMLTPVDDRPVGIGFFVWSWDKGQNPQFGHNGRNEGAEAIMSGYTNPGKGAVIMINSNEGFPLLGEIQRAIAREYEWPGYFDDEKKPAVVSSNALASCVGHYATKTGLKFSVADQKGTLFLKSGDQAPIELRPISETKFSVSILNDTDVTFTKTDKGGVKGLNLSQEGTQISAERER